MLLQADLNAKMNQLTRKYTNEFLQFFQSKGNVSSRTKLTAE